MNSFPEIEFAEHLIKQVKCPSSLTLYALVDGTETSAPITDFFKLAPDAEYYPLFLHTEYEECLPNSPYLIEVTQAHQAYIQQSGCFIQNDVCWFISGQSLNDLAAHFQSLTSVILPNHNCALFRYWSGTILHRYLQCLTLDQHQSLLPPMQQLFTPHREAMGWTQWHIGTENVIKDPQDAPWWTIQQEHLNQFHASSQATLVNEVVDQFWRGYPQLAEQLYPAAIPVYCEQAIATAQLLGLNQIESFSHFISLKLTQAGEFWKQEPFAEVWNRPQTEADFNALIEKRA